MNKLLILFILSLFTAMCSISSVAKASECATDPNECTLSKLCEMATSSDSDGNTIWSISSDKLKHTTAAQSLGIKCGVKPIVDLCDTDPNECKLNQICDKATTEISGKKSWDESADAYVSFAKNYGLSCNVDGETIVEVVNTKDKLCNKATIIKNGEILWNIEFPNFVIAAKNRGKTCNVNAISSVKMIQNKKDNLCNKATTTKNGQTSWNTKFIGHVLSAQKNNLTCGVNAISSPKWMINPKLNNIKKHFLSKSIVYRKKLQHALKVLDLYPNKIDGLWGEGTSSGFDNFIKLHVFHDKTEDQVFNILLFNSGVSPSNSGTKKCTAEDPKDCSNTNLCNLVTEIDLDGRRWVSTDSKAWLREAVAEAKQRGLHCSVEVNKTTIIKKKAIVPTKDNAGLTAIISNPSISGRQALAICRPQAKLAKSRSSATANSSRNNRTRTYDLDCSFGSCTARDMTPSGGKWGGILQGLTEVMAGKNAYNAVMDSCLAQYGWRD